MPTRELHIGNRELTLTALIPALLPTRMVSRAQPSAWMRTDNGDVFRIIAMTLKVIAINNQLGFQTQIVQTNLERAEVATIETDFTIFETSPFDMAVSINYHG